MENSLPAVTSIQEEEEAPVPDNATDFSASISLGESTRKPVDAVSVASGDEFAASKKKVQLPTGKKGAATGPPQSNATSTSKSNRKTNPTGIKGKSALSSKKKGGLNSSSGHGDGHRNGDGSKLQGDTISEDIQEEGPATSDTPAEIGFIDPDIRMIEEFHRTLADQETKWEHLLDTSDIIHRRDTRNKYIMSCKVLGIVPASCIVASLEAKEIKVAHRGLGAKGAQALAESLEYNNCVEYLDLEDNWIGIGGTFLGSALTSNISITYVNLSDNRLGRQSGLAIASMLSANKILKTLLLAGNDFSDKEAEQFGSSLAQNKSLKVLDLSRNRIGDPGISALGAGLARNDSLTDLNLAWNQIRTKGFVAFFNAIRDNSTITNLNLERNGIGESVNNINVFLSRCQSLTQLNISANRIGDNIIQLVAKALETNSYIQDLDVSKNLFTDKGAVPLLKGALNSSNIQKLNLRGVRLTKEALIKVEELKKEKPDLQIVECS